MNNECMARHRGGNVVYRWVIMGLLPAMLAIALAGMVRAGTEGPDSAHHREYRAALDAVLEGRARILDEMRRIRRGDVAHYDFLQYEHIELIRHARALAHPPAALDDADQARITALAAEVLDEANELEWLIADFLRAHALEEIREKNPDRVTVQTDPDRLMEQLAQSPVTEAAEALERYYRGVSGS